MDLLRFADVSKSFGSIAAVARVSFAFGPGRIVGLIGDNGAGKTTTIRLAAGLLQPDSGAVALCGERADRESRSLMFRVGALIEGPGHYDELTVVENLRYFYAFYATRTAPGSLDRVVEDWLRRFGLEEVSDRAVSSVSSGYRQRLAVARALHPWVEVALLDEPFVNLDPRAKSQLKALLRDLKVGGKLVLFSSHTLTDVEQLADDILLLVRGRLHRFRDFGEIRRLVGESAAGDPDVVYDALHRVIVAREERRP